MFWLILFIILLILAISPELFIGSLMILYWVIVCCGSCGVPVIIICIILPELYKLFFRWEKYYGNETYDKIGRNALRIILLLALVLGIAVTVVSWPKFLEIF